MKSTELKNIKKTSPYFLKHKTVWSSYDRDADVLYLHFKKSSHSDIFEMTEDEVITRYENNKIIRMTILNASQRV